jgi:hypothetical protein
MTNKEKDIVFVINFVLSFIFLTIFHWIISFFAETHNYILFRLAISFIMATYIPILVPKKKNDEKEEK